MDLLQMWFGCFLGGPLPDLFKIKLLHLFLMELLVILCIFQILKSFSLKPLTEIIHISWLIKFFLISIFLWISVWRPQCHLALLFGQGASKSLNFFYITNHMISNRVQLRLQWKNFIKFTVHCVCDIPSFAIICWNRYQLKKNGPGKH